MIDLCVLSAVVETFRSEIRQIERIRNERIYRLENRIVILKYDMLEKMQ